MQFTPKTEKEIIEANLWPASEYGFTIAKAEDTVSKGGNPMIKLTMNIVNNEARSMIIFDYLLEAIEYKLRHCAEACGLLGKYETGHLNAIDFEGKEGTLKLVIQKGNDQYPNDKNSVADYIVDSGIKLTPAQDDNAEAHARAEGNAYVADTLDDDIPY